MEVMQETCNSTVDLVKFTLIKNKKNKRHFNCCNITYSHTKCNLTNYANNKNKNRYIKFIFNQWNLGTREVQKRKRKRKTKLSISTKFMNIQLI